MKNKMILSILLFISLFTIFCEVKAYAGIDDGLRDGKGTIETSIKIGLVDPLESPTEYEPEDNSDNETKLKEKASVVLGAINAIGVVVSVVILMIIGIKYMLGSVEEKAEYKKTMLGYFIGAILLFGTTTIVNIIYQIATNF